SVLLIRLCLILSNCSDVGLPGARLNNVGIGSLHWNRPGSPLTILMRSVKETLPYARCNKPDGSLFGNEHTSILRVPKQFVAARNRIVDRVWSRPTGPLPIARVPETVYCRRRCCFGIRPRR